jgi:hypothetical protein
VQLDKWFCGCGSPDDAAAALLRLLRLHPLYDHHAELDGWIDDSGVQYLLLYQLDALELTEHGGTVGGGWLSDAGVAVRDALAREEADGFEALMGSWCIHGFDVEDESHDCLAAE